MQRLVLMSLMGLIIFNTTDGAGPNGRRDPAARPRSGWLEDRGHLSRRHYIDGRARSRA